VLRYGYAVERRQPGRGEGELVSLVGPNGAGKTTTLRIVCTLILPTSGSASVFGLDAVGQSAEIRKIISYLPEEAGAYPNLSGWEYLKFMAKFLPVNGEEAVAEAAEKQIWDR
jgi:ABC-2 type transport system ATP-binding protein